MHAPVLAAVAGWALALGGDAGQTLAAPVTGHQAVGVEAFGRREAFAQLCRRQARAHPGEVGRQAAVQGRGHAGYGMAQHAQALVAVGHQGGAARGVVRRRGCIGARRCCTQRQGQPLFSEAQLDDVVAYLATLR